MFSEPATKGMKVKKIEVLWPETDMSDFFSLKALEWIRISKFNQSWMLETGKFAELDRNNKK